MDFVYANVSVNKKLKFEPRRFGKNRKKMMPETFICYENKHQADYDSSCQRWITNGFNTVTKGTSCLMDKAHNKS